MDENCPNWIKLLQNASKLSKLDQTCANWIKFVELDKTCPNLQNQSNFSKLVQTCPNWINLDQTCKK